MEIDVRRTETQPNRSGGMFTPSGFRAAQLSPMNDNFQTFAGPLRQLETCNGEPSKKPETLDFYDYLKYFTRDPSWNCFNY
uniref:Uncharacterized protein n=1 Tax=Angiostrongylus cantonensis TaxID=6313 RepID=A0A0K0D5G8_ANGCA